MPVETPRFQKPVNWLAWIPLAVGALLALQFRNSSPAIAGVWGSIGLMLAVVGQVMGTETVRAYRLYAQFLANGELKLDENIAVLKDAFYHYPHPAIGLPLIRALVLRKQFRDLMPVTEALRLWTLSADDEKVLDKASVRAWLEVGRTDRALEIAEQISARYAQDESVRGLLNEVRRTIAEGASTDDIKRAA